jgi:hypothetical protein
VLRIERPEELAPAWIAGERHGFDVKRVWLTVPFPLAMVPLPGPSAAGAPLTISVPSAGPLREVLRQLPALRALRARVHLRVSSRDNLIAIRQLASLGVECTAVLGDDSDWLALGDLITYAVLGLVPHAAIQPFAHLVEVYRPDRRTDFGAVYFDDPTQFVHVDTAGRLALSAADLAAGKVLPVTLDRLDDVPMLPEYCARIDEWSNHFVRIDGCSSCAGFRICLGKMGGTATGCASFFAEALEVVERAQQARALRSA